MPKTPPEIDFGGFRLKYIPNTGHIAVDIASIDRTKLAKALDDWDPEFEDKMFFLAMLDVLKEVSETFIEKLERIKK